MAAVTIAGLTSAGVTVGGTASTEREAALRADPASTLPAASDSMTPDSMTPDSMTPDWMTPDWTTPDRTTADLGVARNEVLPTSTTTHSEASASSSNTSSIEGGEQSTPTTSPARASGRDAEPGSASVSATVSVSTTISLRDIAVHPSRPTTTSTTISAPSTPQQRRGAEALEAISYPWQSKLGGWTIAFHPGRSGVYGYTYTDKKHIDIFVRDGMSDSLLAHVVAHELGHAVDVTLNSGDDRREWQAARDIGGSPWWPGSGAGDFSSGAGDFAESFATWQVGSANFRSKLSGPPTSAELSVMQSLAAG